MSDKANAAPAKFRNVEDYLAAERHSATRNEYNSGRVITKSGANRWHNRIVANTAIAVGSRIGGQKCEIYITNMRVRLRGNMICYPDISIVAGEAAFADAESDLLLNPTAIIEVVSQATQTMEKTQRLESILGMESIRDCLFVRLDEMRVEHYSRQNAKQWIFRIYNEREDVISLDSVGCKVSIQEIYSQVRMDRPPLNSRSVN